MRRGLSAGRVQSVALRLIVEREREIAAFKSDEYWEVDVALWAKMKDERRKIKEKIFVKEKVVNELPAGVFVARVVDVDGKKYEPKSEKDVTNVVVDLKAKSTKYKINHIERKERKRASLPPFTTSTLQQAAATRLGFTSKQTMALAQALYEEGLITYHRTDSVNLSTQAVSQARNFIQTNFGQQYVPTKVRIFSKKSKNAQEAHEAIRATDVTLRAKGIGQKAKLGPRHEKLYDLIWRRFVASQMETAVYDSTTVVVLGQSEKGKGRRYSLRTSGSVLKFDGWMKLFPGSGDRILPKMREGQDLDYLDLNAVQKFTQPPARYNDASLVKTLEEKGIGRPSTYASIISVIVARGYVERVQRRFFATAVGMTVSDFLLKNFPKIMDYDFTAAMEADLDRIAHGEKQWKEVVRVFYQPFEKQIDQVIEKAQRVQIPVEKTGKHCPKCYKDHKGEIVIRSGKYGKFYSCSRFPDCDYTENIVEKIGVKCPLCRKGSVVKKPTRWGKPFFGCSQYPECNWASWKKPEKGETISKAKWKKMQAERAKRKKAREKGRKKKAGA